MLSGADFVVNTLDDTVTILTAVRRAGSDAAAHGVSGASSSALCPATNAAIDARGGVSVAVTVRVAAASEVDRALIHACFLGHAFTLCSPATSSINKSKRIMSRLNATKMRIATCARTQTKISQAKPKTLLNKAVEECGAKR